jgi:transcription elongation factor GreB
MSRAFVNESDGEFDEDDVPEIKIPLPPGSRNYMTPVGAERIRSELERLVGEERPRASSEVSDLVSRNEGSDRAALNLARKRLREIDRRIEYLHVMVSRLEVIDPAGQDGTRVMFGARVTVLDEEGKEEQVTIVGVDESDPERGLISFLPPLARALIAKREGETVTAKLPDRERRLRILRVSYQSR